MKRLLVFFGAFVLCALLAGCAPDTHDGLVSDTIQMIGLAANEVGNIKSRVDEAIKRAEDGGKKLDLADAVEATTKLKQAGDQAQEIGRRIAKVRGQITDEERKINAQKHRSKLNAAFEELLKQKGELRAALAKAEALDANAKSEVKLLREKIIEAESPFEALSRSTN
jgi:predicted  nucleic acid-binding Zn-ribbon protein